MIRKVEHLVGVPTFSKRFGIDKKSVRRMIDKNYLSAVQIEGRLYIDMKPIIRDAMAEDLPVETFIYKLCGRSSSYR